MDEVRAAVWEAAHDEQMLCEKVGEVARRLREKRATASQPDFYDAEIADLEAIHRVMVGRIGALTAALESSPADTPKAGRKEK